jgi:hypothetical protein
VVLSSVALVRGASRRCRSAGRHLRLGEGDEEGIALRIHLRAEVGGEGVPQQPAVLGKGFRTGIRAEGVEQSCRPLDVGDEEGAGPGREVAGHGGSRYSRISWFSSCVRGSSTFSACSAPVTGSFAGSIRPTCTRRDAWSQ